MCQHQFHQTSSLKNLYIMTTHQARHHRNQLSVLALSSKNLSMNMVSSSHLEDEDEEMIQSDIDSWIKHLNTLWNIRFEQREPPTDDKVIQINLGSETNPKPIFISESLSPSKKEDLIHLI